MSLQDLLKDKLPEEKLSLIPKGFEVIGDIAIVSIPEELDDEKYLIAEALASHRKDVKTVLRKLHKIKGDARAGEFELLKDGENVMVMFAGVGPFLIPIKKSKNVDMTGLDSNPAACTFLKKNCELNGIDAKGVRIHFMKISSLRYGT